MIDTHVAVWAVEDDRRLNRIGRDLMQSADSVAVSAASIWEIAIKFALRRGRRDDMTFSAYEAMAKFEESGFDLLGVDPLHAAAVGALPHLHGDPFDRLLVAQAAVEGMRLLTHDKTLAAYGNHVIAL